MINCENRMNSNQCDELSLESYKNLTLIKNTVMSHHNM